jgi:hypothetical protein
MAVVTGPSPGPRTRMRPSWLTRRSRDAGLSTSRLAVEAQRQNGAKPA